MSDINELRRLAQAATPGPWKLLPVGDKSKCFAVADIDFLSVLTVVYECGTSFGAVYFDGDAKFIAAANPATVSELLDRLESTEKERDWNAERLEDALEELTALRAKIEAMEQQGPVGKFIQHPSHGMWEQDGYSDNPDAKPLYLAPGAKGE